MPRNNEVLHRARRSGIRPVCGMCAHFLAWPRCMKIQSGIFGSQIIELERISVVGPLCHPPVLHCPPLTDFSPGFKTRTVITERHPEYHEWLG
jgi:hypothetical protein